MIDPTIHVLFQASVLPVMRALPTADLIEMRDYLLSELDSELKRRENMPPAPPPAVPRITRPKV